MSEYTHPLQRPAKPIHTDPWPYLGDMSINITNPTQPGEEEGEVVPVPIHIIVDNAADFPCGGGGGGNAKRISLLPTFVGAIEGMCGEVAELGIAIVKSGAVDPDISFLAFPSASYDSSYFIVEPDTSYFMYVYPIAETMTFDSEIGVVAIDADTDVDLTDACFPYDEDHNRYSISANGQVLTIEFSIPSSAGRVEFNFGGQK